MKAGSPDFVTVGKLADRAVSLVPGGA
jgi:hypothetical protein